MYKEELKYVYDNISKDLDRLELIRDTLGRLYVQYDINLKIIKSKLWYNCTSRIIVENTNMLFSAVHKLDYCKLDFISKLSYPISYIEDNNEEVFKQVTEAMAKFIALLETEMAKIQNEHINLLKSFGLLISNYEIHLEDYVPEVIVNSKVNFEDVRKDYGCNCGCNNKPSEEEKDDNIIDAEVEEPVVEEIIATNYVLDTVEPLGDESKTFQYVCKDKEDVYALQNTDRTDNFKLVKLDPNTYNSTGEIEIALNSINPTSMYMDDEFIFISSMDTSNNGKNKVITFKREGLASNSISKNIGAGWGYNNVNDQPWHPLAVATDNNNIYIACSKGRLLRVFSKDTIRNNWDRLGNNIAPDAYILLDSNITHNNNSKVCLYSTSTLLTLSYTGTNKIYQYNIKDITSGEYNTPAKGKTYNKSVAMPFRKDALHRILSKSNRMVMKFDNAIYVVNVSKFDNLDFSTYILSCAASVDELSILDIKIDTNAKIWTCEKGNRITEKTLNLYNVSSVSKSTPVSNTVPLRMLTEEKEICKDEFTDKEFNSITWNVINPIKVKFDNETISITSCLMKELRDAKIVVKINGLKGEYILMDYTKNGTGKALIPFMDNKYKVDLFKNGGVIEDLEGNKIKLEKLNPHDITAIRLEHNDETLKKIEQIKADWDLGFTGSKTAEEGSKWVRVNREYARKWIMFITNLAYLFSSETFFQIIDHYTYISRCIFKRTPGSENSPARLYHLDVNDPEYKKQDQYELFGDLGLSKVPGVTRKKARMALGVLDWKTSNGAAGLGGGGILGVVRGYLDSTAEDVCNYVIAHEFGHSAGYAHGSSFAYGEFSDGWHPDGVRDIVTAIGKTLLRMRDLPYTDQFTKNDQLALDQIETKVYLSLDTGWWSGNILEHVTKKAEVLEQVVEDYNLVYNSSTNANLNNNQKHNKAMEALEAKYKLTATDRNILNSNKGNPRKLFNHHTANSATNNSFNPDTSFILN